MQDFPEKTEMGYGFSWTALYKSWDWAHYGRFYFIIQIHHGDEIVKQIKVFVDDRGYGDTSCTFTDSEIRSMIKSELHSLALEGESNTEYV